jgi:hypothetical protein
MWRALARSKKITSAGIILLRTFDTYSSVKIVARFGAL